MNLQEEARELCLFGLEGLLLLWNRNATNITAFRGTTDTRKAFYPTATLHWGLALAECGLLVEERRVKKSEITAFDFTVPCGDSEPPTRQQMLNALWHRRSRKANDEGWVDNLIRASSHGTGKDRSAIRQLIPLGHLSDLLYALTIRYRDNAAHPKQGLQAGLRNILDRTFRLFNSKELNAKAKLQNIFLMSPLEMLEDRYLSPYLALYATTIVQFAGALFIPKNNLADLRRVELLKTLRKHLTTYFELEVHSIVARRANLIDPKFDPVSLIFSLRGWQILDDDVHRMPFFLTGVETVVEAQHPDGCWGDGISVSFEATSDLIQQQSIEIALTLASVVFKPQYLQHCSDVARSLIDVARPALIRSITYLSASRRREKMTSGSETFDVPGWVSDRVRAPGLVETWTTALATRLALNVFMIERVLRRANVLELFEPDHFQPVDDPWVVHREQVDPITSRWSSALAESGFPDDPVNVVRMLLLQPVEEYWKRGYYTVVPPKQAVSFLIFGPPGSGKTYFVKQVAAALGWPLVSLNPGHFIAEGLDSIESTASSIFRQLHDLEHTIVFFDECDELFRDREEVHGSNRNILSFVTACMLPKLQELHDSRKVVFFVATNYLRRIDLAVRRTGRFDRILLLDRPDEQVRKALAENELKTRFKGAKKSTYDACVKTIVDATAGITATELIQLANAVKDDGSMPKGYADNFRNSQADYVEWCVKYGESELEAAKIFEEADITKIVANWKKVPGYDAAFRKMRTVSTSAVHH